LLVAEVEAAPYTDQKMQELRKFLQSKGRTSVKDGELTPYSSKGVNESVEAYEHRVHKMLYLVTSTSFK